ncbi:enhancer of mRNA-decapping protein 4-like isoform X2 [Clytia hemisphaerica]|uniref:Enhancer of mRNA-decapping protein 4 WD40 repeat region domain-containing protein n=1 Tax=Clytia hemisphaerica TaxID=252671 RepID=A0A7M5WQI7_9CNID
METPELQLQEIECAGNDENTSHQIHSKHVRIKPSISNSFQANTASNKVKVSQISKLGWKEKFYLGNLVSCNETFFAYIIQARTKEEADSVRVMNQHTSSRTLIKGFNKRVVDISFESFRSNRLACVDSTGTLHVYEISDGGASSVEFKSIIKISRKEELSDVSSRVVWAPNLLLPVEAGQDTMLALSTGKGAVIFNLEIILKNHGEDVYLEDIKDGVIILKGCHKETITCLALSPDKRVLATSSVDGEVKFWGFSFEEPNSEDEEPNCLHEWEPHDGKPVTSLFFCDDLLIADDSSPFWRYLITGTDYNTTLKVWCAVKWECLQTIEFSQASAEVEKPSKFKVALDITAKYLLLADIYNPVVYVCQLHKDDEPSSSFIFYVSEFLLKEPLLSFSIHVAKERKEKSRSVTSEENGDQGNGENDEDGDQNESLEQNEFSSDHEDNDDAKERLSIVTLFSTNRASLQKLSIKFKCAPFPGVTAPTNTTSQDDLLSLEDRLSDLDVSESINTDISDVTDAGRHQREQPAPAPRPPILTASVVEKAIQDSTVPDILPRGSLETEHFKTPAFRESPQLLDFQQDSRAQESVESVRSSNTDLATALSLIPDSPTNSLSTNSDGVTGGAALTNSAALLEPILDVVSKSKQEQTPEEKVQELTTPRSEELFESLSETVNAGLILSPPNTTPTTAINHNKTPLGYSPSQATAQPPPTTHIQEILQQQQNLIQAQQTELAEIKEMLKVVLSQQQQQLLRQPIQQTTDSFPAPPTIPTTPTSSSTHDSDSVEDIKVHMQLLQKSAASQFSKANKEFSKQCTNKLDQFVKDVGSVANEKEERTTQILSNIVNNTIAMKLEKTIRTEMKQTVLAGMEKMTAKYFESLNNQVAQKISLWERTLREECAELVKSKPVAESIGYAAASILEGTIPNAYRESFQSILLPGFEKASMNMFMQINRTFQQGTKQYLERLDKHMESKNSNQEDTQENILTNLHDLVQSFQGTADRLTTGVETNLEALMQKQLRDATDRMQTTFGKTIESKIIPSLSRTISQSAQDSFKEFKQTIDSSINSMLSSAAVAAANSSNETFNVHKTIEEKKTYIDRLFEEGDYNTAFETALSASDLQIVLFACGKIDPYDLFNPSSGGNTSLTQPIILSLIQQLSQNLTEDTDIKTKYLEESLICIDCNEEVTRTHLPSILQTLNEQLAKTIDALSKESPPNKKQIRSLKKVQMASNGLFMS